MKYIHQKQNANGYLLVLVLVFGAIFLSLVTAFVGYVVLQSKGTQVRLARDQSLNIAEAGLDYYKWYLAHYPNGTTTPGPYVHEYVDPEGTALGEFSLSVASSTACGSTYAMDITSVGHTYENPNVTRTVYGRYARPTVSEFSYIINSNVWVGSDHVIIGPYHSNGAIRMDGTNNSTVSSGQETWVCDGSISCSPSSTGSTVNGVYGSGPNDEFWNFPVPPVNFTGLTIDLAAMQDKAVNAGGKYFGPSGKAGYHVVFKSNGTFDIYRVNSKQNEPNGYAWGRYMHILNGETLIGNYAIPTGCGVIYIEDQVWIEGVVKGKVTIAAADVDTVGVDPSIILNNNITYATATSGILAIAEYDVLIGLVVPDDMVLNGIFIAQNGHFGRNHYDTSMPNAWEEYIKRNSLTMNGSIVSNGAVGTKWMSGSTYVSGFNYRYSSYDRKLVADPPPLTPEVSDTYEFIEWREVN